MESAGIPPGASQHTYIVQFNHLESLEYQLKRHEGEIACFILEPCMTNGGVIPPDPGYLKAARELTRKYSVLLIFDEVKIGCRIAAGGACEKYGIVPDLVTLAKAIGGGTPLGAFGGRIALVSIYHERTDIEPNTIVFKELKVFGSFDYRWIDFENALHLIADGRVATGPLITHKLPLSRIQEGIALMQSREAIKVLLEP